MTATLRPARLEDQDRLVDIWYSGWRDGHAGSVTDDLVAARSRSSFVDRLRPRIATTTVATGSTSDVLGFVTVVNDEVEQLYVDVAARGTGLAAALLEAGARQVRRNGHKVAWLAVVAGNARARRFYERNGWRDTGRITYLAERTDGDPITVDVHRYECGET